MIISNILISIYLDILIPINQIYSYQYIKYTQSKDNVEKEEGKVRVEENLVGKVSLRHPYRCKDDENYDKDEDKNKDKEYEEEEDAVFGHLHM